MSNLFGDYREKMKKNEANQMNNQKGSLNLVTVKTCLLVKNIRLNSGFAHSRFQWIIKTQNSYF